jgi:hypothetical protein
MVEVESNVNLTTAHGKEREILPFGFLLEKDVPHPETGNKTGRLTILVPDDKSRLKLALHAKHFTPGEVLIISYEPVDNKEIRSATITGCTRSATGKQTSGIN